MNLLCRHLRTWTSEYETMVRDSYVTPLLYVHNSLLVNGMDYKHGEKSRLHVLRELIQCHFHTITCTMVVQTIEYEK